jgi:nitric oxide reductase large subunit
MYIGVRQITNRIFIGVYGAQADCQRDIHRMYQWVRRIADIIFIGVYRSQADYRPNIHWCI